MKNYLLKPFVLFSTIVGLMSSCIPVFASDTTHYLLIEEAESAIISYQSSFESSTVYSLDSVSSTTNYVDITGYDVQQICKYQRFNFNLNNYHESGKFFSLFQDDIKYDVPYENETSAGIISLAYDENQTMSVLGYSRGDSFYANDVLDTQAITASVASSFSEETAQNIIYLNNPIYNIKLAYFEDSGIEYVIPFIVNNLQTPYEGFIEGSIYTADDFAAWMENAFTKAPSTNEQGEIIFGGPAFIYTGGYSITPAVLTDHSSVFFYLYPTISAVLLIGAVTFFVITKKSNQKKDASLVANPT